MNNEKRAAVAFICGNKNRTNLATFLYDYEKKIVRLYSITKNGQTMNIYDIDKKSYLHVQDGMVYDFDSQSYIQLNFTGNNFNGYDAETQTTFMGEVINDMIRIYDYEFERFFNYMIT